MEECCNNEECCEDECCSGEDYCEISKMLLDISVDAWEELMMEKMKKAFEAKEGAKMDKLAELAVAHSSKVWEEKLKAKDMNKEASSEEIEEYKKKVLETFTN